MAYSKYTNKYQYIIKIAFLTANDPVVQVNTPPTRPTTNNSNNSNNTWTRPNSVPRTNNATNSYQNNNSTRRNNSDSGYNSSQNRSTILPSPTGGNTSVNRRNPSTDTGEILCNCGVPAVLLTVRKDGPNKGRKFYKCQNGRDRGGCDYFLWAPSDQSTSDHQNPHSPDAPTPPTSAAGPCNCGQPAVLRTVQKDGPNKGRQFYCCNGSMQNKCNFFQWATDGGGDGGWNSNFSSGVNGGGSYRGRGGGRGGGTKRKSSNSSGGNPGVKRRKCGICQTEGNDLIYIL